MRVCLIAALVMMLAGLSACSRQLTQIRESDLGQNMPQIEPGLKPSLTWHGARPQLHTYWGDQSVVIHADVWLPDVWKSPGDEHWRVTATTAGGVRLPFIGIVRPFVGEKGQILAELWPPLDLLRAPDGLYIVIYPNITADGGKVQCIAPVAAVREIRGNGFKPYEVKIPLIPAEDSAMTPDPKWEPPKPPAGTPIPVTQH